MKDKLTLSIVTIVKNDFEGFKDTIKSLLNSSWGSLELIIIDSSTTEEVRNLLSEIFQENNDVHYFWVPPEGIYSAMNFGLGKARGTWVWYLNAGDVLSSEASLGVLESDLLEHASFDAIAYSVEHVTDTGLIWSVSVPEISGDLPNRIIDANHQGFIAKKDAIQRVGKFDQTYRFAADSKLMDQICNIGAVNPSSQILSRFRIGGTSSRNFRNVLLEIAHHRKMPRTIRLYITMSTLILKNRLRIFILDSNSRIAKNFVRKLVEIRNH